MREITRFRVFSATCAFDPRRQILNVVELEEVLFRGSRAESIAHLLNRGHFLHLVDDTLFPLIVEIAYNKSLERVYVLLALAAAAENTIRLFCSSCLLRFHASLIFS